MSRQKELDKLRRQGIVVEQEARKLSKLCAQLFLDEVRDGD